MMSSKRTSRRGRALARVGLSALALLSVTACGGEPPAPLADEQEDVESVSEAAIQTKFFGAFCQEGEYEIRPDTGQPWLTATGVTMCNRFNQAMNPIATSKFYQNLKPPAKQHWENTWDYLSMETVDLAFGYLHGGISPQTSYYGLWKNGYTDPNQMAHTMSMRLGDETNGQRGLSILATYSCQTFSHDEYIWARLGNLFRGGLRMGLGSHVLVPFGASSENVGKTLAESLAQGTLVKEAWRRALASVPGFAPGIAMASGTSGPDCGARRDGMTWANFNAYSRVRDGNLKALCWTKWE